MGGGEHSDPRSLVRRGSRVALDVDHVLALVYDVMIDEWNIRKGRSAKLSDATEHDEFKTGIGMTQQDFTEFYGIAWGERWRDIRPAVTPEELKKLMSAYNVDLVTNRPPELVEKLVEWLGSNFKGMTFNIVLSSSAEKFKLDYDIYIDDGNPLANIFISDAGKSGKRLLLVSAPWNNGKDFVGHHGIIGVMDLREAIAMLTTKEVVAVERQMRSVERSTG